ncbi:MAG TPA: hypothetical protein VK509_22460, partial [Polyangiales bacterium]|nr:hypothetical protein [Polyangiales bacterium]
ANQWLGFESDGAGNLALVARHGAERTALTLPAFARGTAFDITVSPAKGELRASLTGAVASGPSWRWPALPVSVGARGQGSAPEPAFAWIGQPTSEIALALECNAQAYADGTSCGEGASWCQDGECERSAACGDGVLDQDGLQAAYEACDDGNQLAGDGCSPDCASEPVEVSFDDAALQEPGVRGHGLGVSSDGGLLFVWQAAEGDSSRLLARRATAAGALVESEAQPIVIADGLELAWPAEPSVAGLPGGGWVVVWIDPAQDGHAGRAVFRIVERDGTLGPTERVTADDSAAQHESSARTAATDDGFIVLWVDERSVRSGSTALSTVLAQRFGAAGEALAPALAVSAPGAVTDVEPAVAALGSQWIAVWTRGDDRSLRLRRFDGDGALEPEQLLALDARSPATTALLPLRGNADYALAWVDVGDDRVRVLELLADYEPEVGNAEMLADPTEERPAVYPSIGALGEHAFAVGFGHGDGYRDAAFSVVERAGHLHTPRADEAALLAILQGPSNQRDLQLTAARNGLWFTWQDDGVPRGAGTTALPNGVRAYLLGCDGCGLQWGPGCFGDSAKLVPSNLLSQTTSTYPGSVFGYSVSAAETLAAVAAPYDATRGAETGSVYVYRHEGGAWVQDAKLTASDAGPETAVSPIAGAVLTQRFGLNVHTDGTRIVVGSLYKDDAQGRIDSGTAYVYERVNGLWSETKLVSQAPATDKRFGISVHVLGDSLLVGEVANTQDPSLGIHTHAYRR